MNISCTFPCGYNVTTKTACSGHGTCDINNETCLCDDEWGGEYCDTLYTFLKLDVAFTSTLAVLATCSIIFFIFCMIWVQFHRKSRHIRAISITMTHVFLFSWIILVSTTFLLIQDMNDTYCITIEWMTFLPIYSIQATVLLKAYRISKIFSKNQSLSDIERIDGKLLFRYYCYIMVIPLILLISFTIFSNYEGGSYDRYVTTGYGDSLDYKIERRCPSEPITMITYFGLVVYEFFIFYGLMYYANASSLAVSLFNETKCIYYGSIVSFGIFLIFGVLLLFTTDYVFQIGVRAIGTNVVGIYTVLALLIPKFKRVGCFDYNDCNCCCKCIRGKQPDPVQRQVSKNILDLKEFDQLRISAAIKELKGKQIVDALDLILKGIHSRAQFEIIKQEFTQNDIQRCKKLVEHLNDSLDLQENDGDGNSDENIHRVVAVTP